MEQLIRVEQGEVKMDSRMIAEHFGKDHKNVLADIRDEQEKLHSEELKKQKHKDSPGRSNEYPGPLTVYAPTDATHL